MPVDVRAMAQRPLDRKEGDNLLIQHYQELKAKAGSSDNQTSPSKIGMTESNYIKQAEKK